jgi:hypothetical protein
MISNRTYGMDADVIAYNARIVAGGNQSLSTQGLRQLNQFVKEIKKIGIWDDMVCWPMRQSHNAGSGTTVYSFGGFAKSTFNGSIINNGTWTPNGILLDPNLSSSIDVSNFIINDLIQGPNFIAFFTPMGTATNTSSEFFAMRYSSVDSVVYGTRTTGGTANSSFNYFRSDAIRNYLDGPSAATMLNVPNYIAYSRANVSATTILRTSAFGATTPIASSGTRTSPSTLSILTRNNSTSTTLFDFVAIFNSYDSYSNRELLKSIFKKTLGQNTNYA